jgi:hypothetical protein
MQLHDLTLERARHDPLAQALEAMHLGLHQAAPVVTAPLLADGVSQPVTRAVFPGLPFLCGGITACAPR